MQKAGPKASPRPSAKVLDRRGIEVDDDSGQWIASCTDAGVLDTWLDRQLVAAKVSELFA